MGLFFAYILKSALCLAAFYLFFRWLMARETFHCFNRFALLGILVLSCLLPLVQVSVEQPTEVRKAMLSVEQLLMMADVETVATAEQPAAVSWTAVVLLIYIIGMAAFAVRDVWSLVKLWRLIHYKSYKSYKSYKEYKLVVHRSDMAPFSWMRYIVISQADLEANGKEILTHELAHIRRRHSWDLLVADVCILFQWFNPAAWLLKQELQAVHEYEADEAVLSEGADAKEYQLLLIRKAVGTARYAMANSFNHSKLKKRITMMQKKKSNPWARAKYLYVLPVAAVAVAAFARPEVTDKVGELSSVKVNDLAAIVETIAPKSVEPAAVKDTSTTVKVIGYAAQPKDTAQVYQVVEEMPQYPDGGMAGLMKFLTDNMRYPEEAKQNKEEGRVVVQFVVDKEGNVTIPTVIRSASKALDAEALRLVSLSPRWIPGKLRGQAVAVKFTVPLMFSLQGSESKAANTSNAPIINISKNVDNVDIYVDGEKIDMTGKTMNDLSIDPSWIQSITIDKSKDSDRKAMYITLKKEGEQPAAGTIKVEGTVIDEQGEPIVGACINVEGSTLGTVTDVDGKYTINAPAGSTLKVSYIGMATEAVKLSDKDTAAVTRLRDE